MPVIGTAVFDLIEEINAGDTIEDVWRPYAAQAHRLGFAFGFAKASSRNTPLAARLIVNAMPDGWLKNYSMRNYERVDGIVSRVRTSPMAFEWSMDEWAETKVAKQKQWAADMRKLGIENGFSVPFVSRGEFRSVTICGKGKPLHPHDRMAMHFAGIELLNRLRELGGHTLADHPKLSRRERECLQWVAHGKSDAEIGTILELSEKTINAYVERAKFKLGATSRVQAIVTALRDGLIVP